MDTIPSLRMIGSEHLKRINEISIGKGFPRTLMISKLRLEDRLYPVEGQRIRKSRKIDTEDSVRCLIAFHIAGERTPMDISIPEFTQLLVIPNTVSTIEVETGKTDGT